MLVMVMDRCRLHWQVDRAKQLWCIRQYRGTRSRTDVSSTLICDITVPAQSWISFGSNP